MTIKSKFFQELELLTKNKNRKSTIDEVDISASGPQFNNLSDPKECDPVCWPEFNKTNDCCRPGIVCGPGTSVFELSDNEGCFPFDVRKDFSRIHKASAPHDQEYAPNTCSSLESSNQAGCFPDDECPPTDHFLDDETQNNGSKEEGDPCINQDNNAALKPKL